MHRSTCDALLGPNEVLVSSAVLTSAEQVELVAWTQSQYSAGKLLKTPPDAGAFSTPFCSSRGGLTRLTGSSRTSDEAERLIWIPEIDEGKGDPLPDLFWRIRDRVVDRFDLSSLDEDQYKGSFISYIAPGTGVHEHRDARLTVSGAQFAILRCNVFLGRPAEGGLPVIRNTLIDVPDRGMWMFFPTELVHSATKVRGDRFRATLSFGFVLPPDVFWDRRFRISPAFADERTRLTDSDETLISRLRVVTAGDDVARQRIDLLEFVLEAKSEFTVRDAAEAFRETPATMSAALCDLQQSGIMESLSSRRWPHETVIVP